MKTVCVLLAACWLGLVQGSPVSNFLYNRPDINKHVPAACFDDKNNVITTGPLCQKKYIVFQHNATWNEAHRNCLKNDKQLVSIRNRFEMEAVQNSMVAEDMTNVHVWIGAHDQGSEGEFKWIGSDNMKMKFTQFALGEPNNINDNEHCLEIGYRYQWNDDNCKIKKYYICEYYETVKKNSSSTF